VTGSEEDTTGRLPYPDDVAGGGCAHDAILTDEELLHAIRSTHLGDGLGDLGVPVTAITTDDEECAISALGNRLKDAGNERLGVVLLLEDLDLLAQTRTVALKSAIMH
jgi:hypothetical protein